MAAAPVIDTMELVLEHMCAVSRPGTIVLLMEAGCESLDGLVGQDSDFAKEICNNVRKSRGGNDADKNVPHSVQTNIHMLVLWCNYMHITQREDTTQPDEPLDPDDVDYGDMEGIRDYHKGLQDQPKQEDVPKFTDNCNKRRWFEGLEEHLGRKVGPGSGLPLIYVITENNLNEHPDFGSPSFDEDLKHRGRHNGKFWSADNRAVFVFLEHVTFGTNAWTCIMRFKRSTDGKEAWKALIGTYRGASARQADRIRGENTLTTIWWDGMIETFPFEKFVSKMRRAFKDAGHTEDQYKIEKMLTHMDYAPIGNISGLVAAQPHLRGNFEAVVAFVAAQIGSTKLIGRHPRNRGVASMKQIKEKGNPAVEELEDSQEHLEGTDEAEELDAKPAAPQVVIEQSEEESIEALEQQVKELEKRVALKRKIEELKKMLNEKESTGKKARAKNNTQESNGTEEDGSV